MSPERDSAGVKVPPPLIFLSGLGLGFVLEALLGPSSIPGALQWSLGILLVLGGVGLQSTFIRAFSRARTAIEPWKPATALVTTGPYRYTRNPAYVGMALIYAGIAVLSDALWVLVALPLVLAVIDRYVIAREERYLERTFGDEYLVLKRRVRRWV